MEPDHRIMAVNSSVITSKEYCNQLNISFKDCALDLFFTITPHLPHLHVHNSLQQSLELATQLQLVNKDDCFFGQLTRNGKGSLEKLGVDLRELYVNHKKFLPATFSPSDVQLNSTNFIRTIESLQYLLHGLYPPANRPAGPIHVNVKSYPFETMAAHYSSCPKLVHDTIETRSRLLKMYASKIDSSLAPFKFLGLKDNISPDRMDMKVYKLYDMFSSMIGNDLPLPDGVKQEHVMELDSTLVDIW
jgi:acid phosphatase